MVQANWGMLSVNNKMARETRQIYQGRRTRILKTLHHKIMQLQSMAFKSK